MSKRPTREEAEFKFSKQTTYTFLNRLDKRPK